MIDIGHDFDEGMEDICGAIEQITNDAFALVDDGQDNDSHGNPDLPYLAVWRFIGHLAIKHPEWFVAWQDPTREDPLLEAEWQAIAESLVEHLGVPQ